MNATLIYADTCKREWGSVMEVFGIATTDAEFDEIVMEVERLGFCAEYSPIELGKVDRTYIGGHCE